MQCIEESLLLGAITRGDFAQTKALLGIGVNANCCDQAGQSALLVALQGRQWDIYDQLLQFRASIDCTTVVSSNTSNITDSTKSKCPISASMKLQDSISSKLHLAIDFHFMEMLHQQWQTYPLLCSELYTKQHLLHKATALGSIDVVRFLTSVNIHYNINKEDNHWYTPLHHAAEHGHVAMVQYLITDHQANITKETPSGRSCMHLAAEHGHQSIVKYLSPLIRGYRKQQDSPLHQAAIKGHLDIVTFFYTHNLYTDTADCNGYTPLHRAVYHGQQRIVEYILHTRKETNHDQRDLNGRNILYFAIKSEDSAVQEHVQKLTQSLQLDGMESELSK